MTLTTGSRLGPYEILSLIGSGGMGEVYKARDTRLDRFVAIKVLQPEVAERPNRRARFEGEARAISSLNHPNICALFDVGDDDGRTFLVMEYLEGETLDDRLTRGPLPVSQALRYAIEIVGALDHAHRAHVVHRDVKPSNVMLTAGGAKLLDFGLAKTPVVAAVGSSTLSLEQLKLTGDGTLVGTFQYMSPEQLDGKPVDERTDIFAVGAVIYEMIAGRKAFHGDSQASLIASILTEHPPAVSSLSNGRNATGSLVALDHVLERCLAKSPDHRWQSARDLHLELEWTAKGTTPGAAPARKRRFQSRRALGWTAGLAASAAAGALAFATLHEPPRQTTRFVIAPAPGTRIGVAENRTRIALSPDGRRLATIASVEGRQQLWLRALDSVVAEPVAGTQGAESPFWSPDSRFVAFFSPGDGQLKKVDVAGGPARTICAAEMESVPVWGADGTILFTQLGDGIYRVSADGGTPTRVTRVDKGRRELNHLWPQFLPDGRHFLYMATAVDANGLRATPSLYAASLDSPDVTMVARMHSRMMLAGPGHVLYVQDGALLAQAFDVVNRRLTGEPMRIADEIAYSRPLGNGGFTVSSNGVLAYQGSADPFSLVWYDRGGGVADAMSAPQSFGSVRLSPDGLRIAADVTDPRTGTADVWIYDAARSAPVRLTTDPGSESQAIWSPDMRRLVFRWGRSGAPSLYERVISTGAETLLASESIPLTPEDWSPDGRWIAYVKQTRRTAYDLWLLPLSGDRKPVPFATTGFDDWGARFSPDSRWVAFASAESGSPEVYVAPIGEPANKTRVSTGGGSTPRWRSDGRELFYASADYRSIMVAATQTGGTFIVGAPARALSLGATPVARDRARNMVYDVSPDGRRFLVSLPAGEPTSSRVTVVLNWTNALNH